MNLYIHPDRSQWEAILRRPTLDVSSLHQTVTGILEQIRKEGDPAVRAFTQQFDKVELDNFQITETEIREAEKALSEDLKKAIQTARQNISRFHSQQQLQPEVVETMPGVRCWRQSRPIEKVGLYIPGGTAPLFSSVLMLGIPAQLAGCKEIILCSPPDQNGRLHPAIIYAAQAVGIRKIFKIGGVQAVGAMAYGTQTVPKVYKIFGPGNQYVTAAKQIVSQQGTAIDMPAGPSEVLVCADHTAQPDFVAADLLSQAEHGVDSQVVLVAFEEAFVKAVQKAVAEQLQALPRADIAREALKNSAAVITKDRAEAIDLINEYAPEHLILSIADVTSFSDRIINAGSVFIGNFTPESVGDYASGTNHTLPTNGFAKVYSGVSLDSFVKKITFQQLSADGLKNLGPAVEEMAHAEELLAHKNAVSIRLAAIRSDEKS
jgi:histidinol dehydrogenase